MNDPNHTTVEHDSTSAPAGRGGTPRASERRTHALSKSMVAIALMLGVVILCGVALRISVGLVSDQPQRVADKNTHRVSRSATEKISARELKNERIREQARRDDRQLLRARHDRLWRDECRDRPGKLAAYEKWRREVDEIEQQLTEARAIQSRLTPEQAANGPLAEGTVLWHRQQRLLELQADAPRL